jgi:hypothetical protein
VSFYEKERININTLEKMQVSIIFNHAVYINHFLETCQRKRYIFQFRQPTLNEASVDSTSKIVLLPCFGDCWK